MMNALRKLLLMNTTITAKVRDRITLGVADQDERRPRIVLTLISSPIPYTFDGPAGYREATVQAACLAPTYREAADLADAAAAILNGYSGTVDGTDIEHAEAEEIEDIESAPIEARAVPTFGRALTVWVMTRTT